MQSNPKNRGPKAVVPVGEKFGRLTVLAKGQSILSAKTGHWATTWDCVCDCGTLVTRRREVVLRRPSAQSCGCRKSELARANQKQPLQIGEKYNSFTVVGSLGGKVAGRYELQCKCGNIRFLKRSEFANPCSRVKSCGCYRDKKVKERKPSLIKDLTGMRFSSLTALQLSDGRTSDGKAVWLCQCDCGNQVLKKSSGLMDSLKRNSWLNCGDRSKHSEGVGLKYPPMPLPMPDGVADLYSFFLATTKTKLTKNREAIEDNRRERLLRVCWILHYREVFLGESLSEAYKKRYVYKSMRYITIDTFWDQKLSEYGGYVETNSGKIKKSKLTKRGVEMANLTFPVYPVVSTPGENLLTTRKRHISFSRR